MNARHAPAHPAAGDPLGLVLSWLWALGTALGFVCLATSVDSEFGDQDTARPALTAPDAADSAAA
ncbi:hypothetical protein [Streptomyces silvensis]|uniref:Uncharacterized protein n=1 Tax=Streptomyces silvensis TaxID=1765722 RepID=A0A0W7WYF5_9ACTN|nr:hypothetical protein [Streptomyces silvensis]KUF15543.1 hypothetical protein AT728_26195 [Streptomyces silvensis]